jgi:glutamate racemase
MPIAVFDSGLGGISVLKELTKILPEEDFWYFGDSANAPYGTKPEEEIRRLTLDKVDYFMESGVKAIAVACNTATSAAVRIIREQHPELPVVGIEPAIKPAVLGKPNSRILVMATPMTLKMEKFQRLMSQYEDQGTIIPLPCPGLMELIEKGCLNGPEMEQYLTNLFGSYLTEPVDSIVLGCTHYPFARATIEKLFGGRVQIYDGGAGTARELARRIRVAGLEKKNGGPGKIVFENSRETAKEIELCWQLYRAEIT